MAKTSSAQLRYCFDCFELIPSQRRLLKNQLPVVIAPRAYDVLVVLVENAGRLVSHQTLHDTVWPRLVVEVNTLHASIAALRKIVGSKSIATVPKYGYRFTPVCTVESDVRRISQDNITTSLPSFETSFVGRSDELLELAQLVARNRFITIHGFGGAGKTRLAVQLLHGMQESFSHGVWFLDLSDVSTEKAVKHRLSSLVGLPESSDDSALADLVKHMSSWNALLLVDNAEHLLDAVRGLVDALLSGCASLKILATSREPIGATGEMRYSIPPLTLPQRQPNRAVTELQFSDSCTLFIERARSQNPTLALTEELAVAVASICHRLDGMPLQIELAASRTRTMSITEIDDRLDQATRLLVTPNPERSRRHRTLRALIEWSYDLLASEEQRVFRGVAVFRGGFKQEAAEAIFRETNLGSDEISAILESLIEKSILLAGKGRSGRRYRQLETVRQFAVEKLEQSQELSHWQKRHLDYFVTKIREATPSGAYMSLALVAMDDETENITAALTQALLPTAQVDLGLEMCARMSHYWYSRGHSATAKRWIGTFLEHISPHHNELMYVRAKSSYAIFSQMLGEQDVALRSHEESVAYARGTHCGQAVCLALHNLGATFDGIGQHARALSAAQDALGVCAHANQAEVAIELSLRGQAEQSSFPEKLQAEEIISFSRSLASELSVQNRQPSFALYLRNVSHCFQKIGDFVGAEIAAREAHKVAVATGDESLLGVCKSRLGEVLACGGDINQALLTLDDALKLFIKTGNDRQACMTLDDLGSVLQKLGRSLDAALLWGATKSNLARLNMERDAHRRTKHERDRADALASVGSELDFREYFELGCAMSMDHVERKLQEIKAAVFSQPL